MSITPAIVYDFSIVDEYLRTFYEHNPDGVNDIIFESIPHQMNKNPILYTTDAVNHALRSVYPERSLELDTIFNGTEVETIAIKDHKSSVFTLIWLMSKRTRPVSFLTLDSFNKAQAEKSNMKTITVSEALTIIRSLV